MIDSTYKVINFLSDDNVEKLIKYSNSDAQIKKFTSDGKRFKNKLSFNEWLKKGRKVYCLVDKQNDLMGICWFGRKGNGFTLALRIYGQARGRGLGYWFLKEAMANFMNEDEYLKSTKKDWWLESSEYNIAAIKIYEKLGFKLSEKGTKTGKLIYRRRHDFEF